MRKILFLVAESSRAKLYSAVSRKGELTELEDLTLPEGRMHEAELVSDKPGSDGGVVGQGRHVLDNQTSAVHAARVTFAKQLVERLKAGRETKESDQLVIAAPPAFLGLLRAELTPELTKMVVEEVDKNLVQLLPDEARKHTTTLV